MKAVVALVGLIRGPACGFNDLDARQMVLRGLGITFPPLYKEYISELAIWLASTKVSAPLRLVPLWLFARTKVISSARSALAGPRRLPLPLLTGLYICTSFGYPARNSKISNPLTSLY